VTRPHVGREARVDLDRFWELVEAAAIAALRDCEAQAEQLTAMLEQLPPEEVVSFERHFTQRLAEAYRWESWGLADQLNGGARTTASSTSAAGCWRRAGPPGRRRLPIRTR
jgi:Protein of unknown function (DUF4240)